MILNDSVFKMEIQMNVEAVSCLKKPVISVLDFFFFKTNEMCFTRNQIPMH